jgi:hypothetical protein
MPNHIEWGTAADALYTLHPSHEAVTILRATDEPDTISPWVLGLWNGNRDGLALDGTRSQLIDYLTRVLDFVKRETDPRVIELADALTRLRELRAERTDVYERYGDTGYGMAEIRRLDEDEVDVLNDVAEAAAAVHNDLTRDVTDVR